MSGLGSKSMMFTSSFQRTWAAMGDLIVGQKVLVVFVDGQQPIVVDVILGSS